MFEATRLRLTAWYLLIIMIISVLFSAAFYQASTKEIQRIIDRIEFEQEIQESLPLPRRFRNLPRIEELQDVKDRSIIALIVINTTILVFAGGAGYFLAGRTLMPIKVMIDEQNQFISNASHELRTPIATLRAELEGSLLEKQLTDQKTRALITSNLEEVSTLQNLTNKLLQLAQLHTLPGKNHAKDISLTDVITTAEKKVALLAKKKNISFKVQVPTTVIKAQFENMTEVFVILFDNAIKYSPEKTIVQVTATRTTKTVSITVKDKGMGISEDDLPHIFERFYRADKSRSNVEGYGLGLSIAKQIIESHHGNIETLSQLGKGTTFILHLPLSQS